MAEWAIWCRIRKWMQHTRDLIAAPLSCMPTLCTIEPCFHMTSRSWLSWEWRLLPSWAFILTVAFIQFLKSFVTQTPPVAVWHSLLWSIYKLCKTDHWCLHCILASWKSFPSSFLLHCRRLNQLSTSLLGGRLNSIRAGIRTVGSIFRMDIRACNRRGCTSSKERANIHVFIQIFVWST